MDNYYARISQDINWQQLAVSPPDQALCRPADTLCPGDLCAQASRASACAEPNPLATVPTEDGTRARGEDEAQALVLELRALGIARNLFASPQCPACKNKSLI